MKPELSLSDLFFSSSQEISAYKRNHETDSKQCSIHARPVCGAVILPQRYTKNGEDDDLAHAHKPCALYTNPTHQQEDEHGTIHLLILMLVNKRQSFSVCSCCCCCYVT